MNAHWRHTYTGDSNLASIGVANARRHGQVDRAGAIQQGSLTSLVACPPGWRASGWADYEFVAASRAASKRKTIANPRSARRATAGRSRM